MFNIYLTNLGKYNEGYLLGKWVSLPMDSDELETVADSLRDPQHEELFVTDFENDYGVEVKEFYGYEELNELAERLEEQAYNWSAEIVAAVVDYYGDTADALDVLERGSLYVYDACYTMEEVAARYCEECGVLDSVTEHLRYYFDFDLFGRDMELEGHFQKYENGYIELIA